MQRAAGQCVYRTISGKEEGVQHDIEGTQANIQNIACSFNK